MTFIRIKKLNKFRKFIKKEDLTNGELKQMKNIIDEHINHKE